MQNYEVKTPVRGLPRVDGLKQPVEIGAVIALPFDLAVELLALEAVEETRAEVTCALVWEKAAPVPVSSPIAVAAVTDRYALVDAIEELGGIVFFLGEGLPDGAEDVLADFSNDQLRAELDLRVKEGRLSPVEPTIIGVDLGSPEGDKSVEVAIDASGAIVAHSDRPAADAGRVEAEAGVKPARKKP